MDIIEMAAANTRSDMNAAVTMAHHWKNLWKCYLNSQ